MRHWCDCKFLYNYTRHDLVLLGYTQFYTNLLEFDLVYGKKTRSNDFIDKQLQQKISVNIINKFSYLTMNFTS